MKIYGQKCEQVDTWKARNDNFILGRCVEDHCFYYVMVNEKYEYEYDHLPSRQEVEDTHIDHMAQIQLDEVEARATSREEFVMYVL